MPGVRVTHVHLPVPHCASEEVAAFLVDDVAGLTARAVEAGAPWPDPGPGRAVLRDPAANLVEVLSPEARPT